MAEIQVFEYLKSEGAKNKKILRKLPLKSTWSHNNTYLCALSVQHRFTYLTARFAAVSKRDVHWVALKHRLNMWTLARFYYVYRYILLCFYYVATGTYCGSSEFKYPGSVPKTLCTIVLEICPTSIPTLNLPDSVNKCKTDIKTYLLMQPCHFNFLICRFDLLFWTVITRDTNRSSSSLKHVSELRELPNKLTIYENPSIQGWICAMLTLKSSSFQIFQLFNIVLKS